MNAVVAEARSWIGTPYVAGASRRGGGCDCLGLVRGVWRTMVGPEPSYPRQPTDAPVSTDVLIHGLRDHMRMVPADHVLHEGQNLVFDLRGATGGGHLGVLCRSGDGWTFLHSYSGRGVTESTLSDPWHGRIVARFLFPMEGR